MRAMDPPAHNPLGARSAGGEHAPAGKPYLSTSVDHALATRGTKWKVNKSLNCQRAFPGGAEPTALPRRSATYQNLLALPQAHPLTSPPYTAPRRCAPHSSPGNANP